MKREIAFFAGLALLTTVGVSGCGTGGSTTSSGGGGTSNSSSSGSIKGQTISVVFTSPAPPQKLLAQFTKQTGVKVKWTDMAWDDIQTKITAAMTANTYFADVTDVDWSRVGQYYQTKWFQPLNQYMDVNSLKSDVPQLNVFTSHGELIGMPVDASIMLTTVNTADFKKAGITTMPTTMDEYNADLNKLVSSGVNPSPLGIPFAAAEGLSTYWYETTAAFGGSVLSADGKPLFTDPNSAGYKAMQWMVNAYKTGLVPKGNINMTDSDEMQNEMATGRISTILSDYSGNVGTIYNVPSQSKVVGQVNYIATPGQSGVGPNLGNPDGMGIPETAEHKAAAAAFIKWITSPDIQADISGANGPSLSIVQWALPSRLSAIQKLADADTNKTTEASVMYQLFKQHTKPPFQGGAPAWYAQFSNAVYTNIHAAALGQETVDQAVKAIATTVNSLNS
ncbi:ABC transporter substrate-binding protein [Alicyclobacillus fastidiosus]|uniref:Extracellular solute-binding protein n=1 Tax=Alicyclobacillus fastidiosus TaxID=392011 RepID=A0ABV5A8R1_9BACL|nr:extracellular solute-binding protein [Alicyclobacillus fastidiosus]WEH10624.1 extracellular solute-binding protein [Alicyclobacillus fastidiosus]